MSASPPRPTSQGSALDLARLPDYGFGAASPMWWGTLGFIAIEGTGFVLAGASYLYILTQNGRFPLGAGPPTLWPGILQTLLLLASVVPNIWVDRASRREDLGQVRVGLLVMSAIGIATCVIRAFEFPALNIYWDDNAYGSLQWLLLGLHATHLGTDLADTLVLAALMFTRHGHGKRFSDVSDNAAYWYFVVAAWLPIYALIYWVPRL